MNSLQKKLILINILCLSTLGLYGPLVLAGPEVDLVGTFTYGVAIGSPAPSQKIGIPGGGIYLNFKLGKRVGIEVGGLYLTRIYSIGTDQTVQVAEGLVGLKFHVSRGFFIDLGGYSAQSITNPLALNGGDFGAYGGFGAIIPLKSSLGFVTRAQYNYALNNLTYGSNNLTPREFLISIGLTFGGSTGK